VENTGIEEVLTAVAEPVRGAGDRQRSPRVLGAGGRPRRAASSEAPRRLLQALPPLAMPPLARHGRSGASAGAGALARGSGGGRRSRRPLSSLRAALGLSGLGVAACLNPPCGDATSSPASASSMAVAAATFRQPSTSGGLFPELLGGRCAISPAGGASQTEGHAHRPRPNAARLRARRTRFGSRNFARCDDISVGAATKTGRLVRVPLYGMTVAEQLGRSTTEPLLDRLSRGDNLAVPRHPPDLRGYVELALQSGFPEAALSLSERTRARWIESYLDQLLTRDAMHVAGPAIQPSSGATSRPTRSTPPAWWRRRRCSRQRG